MRAAFGRLGLQGSTMTDQPNQTPTSDDAGDMEAMFSAGSDVAYLFAVTGTGFGMNLDGRITVKGAAQSVLYFSDRPNRLVGSMATRDLVTRWDAGADTFGHIAEAVGQIARMFGWETHLGHLCGGGTMANLEALWVSGALHPGKKIAASNRRMKASSILPFMLEARMASPENCSTFCSR